MTVTKLIRKISEKSPPKVRYKYYEIGLTSWKISVLPDCLKVLRPEGPYERPLRNRQRESRVKRKHFLWHGIFNDPFTVHWRTPSGLDVQPLVITLAHKQNIPSDRDALTSDLGSVGLTRRASHSQGSQPVLFPV